MSGHQLPNSDIQTNIRHSKRSKLPSDCGQKWYILCCFTDTFEYYLKEASYLAKTTFPQTCAANHPLCTIPAVQCVLATRVLTARACCLATDAWNSVGVLITSSSTETNARKAVITQVSSKKY